MIYQIVFSKIINHGPGKTCKGCPWCRPSDLKNRAEAEKIFKYASEPRDYSIYYERSLWGKWDYEVKPNYVRCFWTNEK